MIINTLTHLKIKNHRILNELCRNICKVSVMKKVKKSIDKNINNIPMTYM